MTLTLEDRVKASSNVMETDTNTQLLLKIKQYLEIVNGWGEEHTFGIHLAVEEALMNAIKHGNQRDPEKFVYVLYQFNTKILQITIAASIRSFTPPPRPAR